MKLLLSIIICSLLPFLGLAQKQDRVKGKIMLSESMPAKDALLRLINTAYQSRTNEKGEFYFNDLPTGQYILQVSINDVELIRENI